MAGRAMILTGIWEHISGAEMKNKGEPLSGALVSAINEMRANPTPETEKVALKAMEDFRNWWGPHFAKMQDEKEKEEKGKGKSK